MHKTVKATTPVSSSRNARQQQAVRPPSPKVEVAHTRRATGSPAPRITSSRSNSRKSPSMPLDTLLGHSRRVNTDDELNDQRLLSLSQHERPSEHRDEQQSIFERSVIEDRVLHEMVEQQKAGSAKQQMHGSSKQFLPDSPVASSPMAVLPLYERDITECTALSALTEAASDDDTHPAGYMGNPTDLARSLTDNQLAKFLEIMQQEADARQTVIDNRRSMRRSRSGGNESAFVSARRPMSKPLCLDQEDEELSGFAASEPILVSRSGAHQPSPHGSPDLSPSSRPASRLSGLVHLQALLPAPCSVPVPIARRPKRQTIEDRLGDLALDDDLSSVVSRELLLSPFSAFDDISVGSQSQSITSSRSSKTRRYALDASPPAVTSKQLHRGAGKPKTSRLVQAGVKKQ